MATKRLGPALAVLTSCALGCPGGASAPAEGVADAGAAQARAGDGGVGADGGDGGPASRDGGSEDAAGALCPTDDAWEENDEPAQAARLDADFFGYDLALCPYEDDWYRITAPADHTVVASVAFSHADGDLDLFLWGAGIEDPYATNAIGASTTTTDDEELYHVSTGGAHLLLVGGDGVSTVPYDLIVQVVAP